MRELAVGRVRVRGLLEAAVYPYLICSPLHGLDSLLPAEAWRLFKCGRAFHVATWVATFAALIVRAQAIPDVQLAVVDATLASKLIGLHYATAMNGVADEQDLRLRFDVPAGAPTEVA